MNGASSDSVTPFETLLQQFSGLWEAVLQADVAQRRVLVAELAKVLLEWEAAQTTPLDPLPMLRRTGYWSTIATVTASQCEQIGDQLGEAKPTLTARLETTRTHIAEHQTRLTALTADIEALAAAINLAAADLDTVQEAITHHQNLLEHLQTLQRLHTDLMQALPAATTLELRLEQGEPPSRIMGEWTDLIGLREKLLAHYRVCCDASRTIAENLLTPLPDRVTTTPSAELEALPQRLEALEQELDAIDGVLTSHLRVLDAQDQVARERAQGRDEIGGMRDKT